MFFNIISVFWAIFSTFCQKTCGKIVKTEFHMSRGKLWRNLCFFWKKCRWSYCFQKWAKNFSLLSKFFRQNCENCFGRVHRINLSFLLNKKVWYFLSFSHTDNFFSAFSRSFSSKLQEKTILKFSQFLTYSRKIWPFCCKNSSRAAKTAFYVLTRTVWNKKFPEKKSGIRFIFFGHER